MSVPTQRILSFQGQPCDMPVGAAHIVRCIVGVLLALSCAACHPAVNVAPLLIESSYDLSPQSRLEIGAREIDLVLTAASGDEARIEARVPAGQSNPLNIVESAGGLEIDVEVGIPVELFVAMPPGRGISVEAFDGSISVQGYQGDLSISLTTGEIEVAGFEGLLWLRTPRGDAGVRDSAGELHLVGEHGILRLEGAHGTLSMTTIMGSLEFAGSPAAGDQVWLESDHGPVHIQLGAASQATLALTSSGGAIRCTVPGLSGQGSDCSGTIGDGSGAVGVRTVSGEISVSPYLSAE